MAATAAVQKTPKQTVLDVLGLMVGADLVRAMEAAFDTSDFTSLQSTLPALGSAGVRALHQAAFEAACAQGRADVAQVLLASESVNAAAAVTTLGVTRTLLQHAVHTDCPDVVRVLLTDASVEATINDTHGEDEDEDEWASTPLCFWLRSWAVWNALKLCWPAQVLTSTLWAMTTTQSRLHLLDLLHIMVTCLACAPCWRRMAST